MDRAYRIARLDWRRNSRGEWNAPTLWGWFRIYEEKSGSWAVMFEDVTLYAGLNTEADGIICAHTRHQSRLLDCLEEITDSKALRNG